MMKQKKFKIINQFHEAGPTLQDIVETNFIIYFHEEFNKIRKNNE